MADLPARGDYLAYVMDVYDEAEKVASLETTVADLTQSNTALVDQHAADVIQHNADLATIADLQAQLDDQTDPPPPPPPPPVETVLIGMSAPDNLWDQRVAEVGPGLMARREFFTSWTQSLAKVTDAIADGMTPILSWKLPSGKTWAQAGAGQCDADIKSLAGRLAAYDEHIWVALHHEPSSGATTGENGTPADFAAMNAHCLPLFKAASEKLHPCVIGNGWWWNTNSQGLSEPELAAWVPQKVLDVAEAVGGDFYQGSATAEAPGPKMRNCSAWATRVGAQGICCGEFNAQTAPAITEAVQTARELPLMRFACLWNAEGTGSAHAHVLTGQLLAAFKAELAKAG